MMQVISDGLVLPVLGGFRINFDAPPEEPEPLLELPGAQAAGTEFAHPANCAVEWTVTPGSMGVDVYLRYLNASNYLRVRFNPSGTLTLVEVVGGASSSTLGTNLLGGVAGDRIRAELDDLDVRLYRNGMPGPASATSATLAGNTVGRVHQVSTGAVSDVGVWEL